MTGLATIILAAGQGTRMRSIYPKVLHSLLGRPMLKYVTDAAENIGSDPVMVVIGFEGEQVIQTMGPKYQYIWQHQQRGTGHAIISAQEALSKLSGDLLVLYGDTPLLRVETLAEFVALKQNNQANASVLTTTVANPSGYGRIIRDSNGSIIDIVEDKDASPTEKEIQEVNTGVYCFTIADLLRAITELSPKNAQGEYYLTDVVKIFNQQGLKVIGVKTDAAEEVMGPNDRCQLAHTENILKHSINARLMHQGVTIQDPDFTYIGPEVEVGSDTIILPGTFLLGRTIIGKNCIIGPHSQIVDSVVADDSSIQFSQVIEANLRQGNIVGPFSSIRPGTVYDAGAKR